MPFVPTTSPQRWIWLVGGDVGVTTGYHTHFVLHVYIGDVKIGPGTSPGLFLQVVGCVNKNLHLIEKQYRELILPAIQ